MGSLLCDSLEPRQAKRLHDADLDLLPSSARQGPLSPCSELSPSPREGGAGLLSPVTKPLPFYAGNSAKNSVFF